MRRTSLPVAFLLALMMAAALAAAPPIGDKAPAVKVAKWVTREPPALPGRPGADQHVFLIEFWATWLPNAGEGLAHLEKLQEKHAKDGLLVLGISNEEPDDIAKAVEKALKTPYYLGADDDVATTAAWGMEDVDIPYAFVVDRSGNVVWRGNSAEDADAMDQAVGQTLAGKIDVQAVKEATETTEKFNKLMTEVRTAYGMKNKEKLFKLLDEMIALKPMELEPYLIKREALRNFDLAEKIADWDAKILETFRNEAATLRKLVSIELGKDLVDRNPELLVKAVLRVNELGDGRDAEALLLLGRVQCEAGLLDAAIATQTEAVEQAPAKAKEYYRKVLAYYQAMKKLGKTLKHPTPTSGKS